jgi:hypothetical protein
MSLTIIRVTIRGVRLPRDTEEIDGVKYSRERSMSPSVGMTLKKDRRRRSVAYPKRNDDNLNISVTSSRETVHVRVELGGSQVEKLVASAKRASTIAEVVQAMKPLLDFVERNFDTT